MYYCYLLLVNLIVIIIHFVERGARTPAMLALLPDSEAIEASGKVRMLLFLATLKLTSSFQFFFNEQEISWTQPEPNFT